MLFFHQTQAGEKNITLENTDFHSLIRVRRKKVDDTVIFMNLNDNSHNSTVNYYKYKISYISKKYANVELISHTKENKFTGKLHLFWGICELKTITTTLPTLNQMGVEKITFVQCERSQGNIKLSNKILEKFNTILQSSCQQCGRNSLIQIDEISFSDYIEYISTKTTEPNIPNNYICNFQENIFSNNEILEFKKSTNNTENTQYTFFIGPEGGFSPKEVTEFKQLEEKKYAHIRKFNTPLVLKSESACIAVAGFFL